MMKRSGQFKDISSKMISFQGQLLEELLSITKVYDHELTNYLWNNVYYSLIIVNYIFNEHICIYLRKWASRESPSIISRQWHQASWWRRICYSFSPAVVAKTTTFANTPTAPSSSWYSKTSYIQGPISKYKKTISTSKFRS